MENRDTSDRPRIAVVIPCYRAKRHILDVVATVPSFVEAVFVVDDACPEGSGEFLAQRNRDPRVSILFSDTNQGVGGATMKGYQAAVAAGMQVIVKVDSDGQMDPSMMAALVEPLLAGEADYAKGNRFYDLTNLTRMPALRVAGNAALSFFAKLSTGYWDLFDPTNGYTAIHASVAKRLPYHRISKRYFFETDLLFRLNVMRAVVVDVPMDARYGDEVSNLKIGNIIGEFLFKHLRNLGKRIFYNYFLRDFTIASIELVSGVALMMAGAMFGAGAWMNSMHTGVATSAGTVMLAALPILLGLQLVLAFLGYDVSSVPRRPLHVRPRVDPDLRPYFRTPILENDTPPTVESDGL